MKKRINLYLFSLLIAIGAMTTSQTLKAETTKAEYACTWSLIKDASDPDLKSICDTACTKPNPQTPSGKGTWSGDGTWDKNWTNDPVLKGKCEYSVCRCTPSIPPVSCCSTCAAAFDNCVLEGKLPRLSCSKLWETCNATKCNGKCKPPTPPSSCCSTCATAFDTCVSEGKLPRLSCSKNWETCERACSKENPGTECTPPKEALLHSNN